MCTHTHTRTHMHAHMCTCSLSLTHTHTHTHTHIHTHFFLHTQNIELNHNFSAKNHTIIEDNNHATALHTPQPTYLQQCCSSARYNAAKLNTLWCVYNVPTGAEVGVCADQLRHSLGQKVSLRQAICDATWGRHHHILITVSGNSILVCDGDVNDVVILDFWLASLLGSWHHLWVDFSLMLAAEWWQLLKLCHILLRYKQSQRKVKVQLITIDKQVGTDMGSQHCCLSAPPLWPSLCTWWDSSPVSYSLTLIIPVKLVCK